MIKNKTYHPASYKDNCARIITINNDIYREIYPLYYPHYEKLINSGLYEKLTNKGILVRHEEIKTNSNKLIKPQPVFISYPYEWSFSQLKDAALLTLKIMNIALEYEMILKDATPYNIQFDNGKPIFIDTTSFEEYKENKTWVAYNQFVRNFICPLAIMSYTDIRLNTLLKNYKEGLDLDLTSKLLPFKTYFNYHIFLHIHMHSKIYDNYSTKYKQININYSKQQLKSLLFSLEQCIKNLKLKKQTTQWDNYYQNTNYTNDSFAEKINIIKNFEEQIEYKTVVDLGANNGLFSRLFAKKANRILCTDIDANAVEENYIITKNNKETNIIPLVFDILNPTPSIGWNNEERSSLFERIKNSDVIMALAFLHHVVIGGNVPLQNIARLLNSMGKYLIIEFIEKEDSQVKKLLCNRVDIFNDYSKENFEKIFSAHFVILQQKQIKNTHRTLYLMKRK